MVGWLTSVLICGLAFGGFEVGKPVYAVKETNVHVAKDPGSEVAFILKQDQAATLVAIDGNWLQVTGTAGVTGWVYSSNVSDTLPKDDLDLAGGQTSSASDNSLAARGLGEVAKYAARQGEAESFEQLQWMIQTNDSFSVSSSGRFRDLQGASVIGFPPFGPPPGGGPLGGPPTLPSPPFPAVQQAVQNMKEAASDLKYTLSPERLDQVGMEVAVDIISHYGGLEKDAALSTRVIRIGKTLAKNANVSGPLRFAILKAPGVNALSSPSGFIFVTRGLVDLVDDNELAAALAHEIAHVEHKDAMVYWAGNHLLTQFMNHAPEGSEVKEHDDQMKQLSDALFTKAFDQRWEFRADREGRELATRSGYPPDSLVKLLMELKKQPQAVNPYPAHPPLDVRITQLQAN